MADLCASILVVLGVAWAVRRLMDGRDPRPLTPVRRRGWVFLSLLGALAVHLALAGLGQLAWRSTALPAALLFVWLVLCRAMVRPRTRAPESAYRSPATIAFTAAAIFACWVAVNPLGERPDEAAATTTASIPTETTALEAPAEAAQRLGSGIVMATRGAIVYVGDNGRLTANTGATSSSGNVALGVKGSDLQSGDSGAARASTRPRGSSTTAGSGARSSGRSSGRSSAGPGAASTARSSASSSHANGSLAALTSPGKGPRGTALSGFEDHSVSVDGDDQIVTYDDSNVFIDRDGQVNANTGDTDSSGLNAVDVGDSTVRAGNSGDSEGGGDEEEEEATASPSPTGGERRVSNDRVAAPQDTGDEDDAEESESTSPGVGPQRGQSYGTVTDEGASIATGKNSFVIGADGYDDVSIRTHGRNDIVTYDDSNVTIGGKGKVNAQIGDSDTGGGVVMGIHGSDVRAGCEGDLCYSANPAVVMAAQILQSSGLRLTPAQQRKLVDFVTNEITARR